MTTKVRVINEGPGDVVVSAISPLTSEPSKSVVLRPGEITKESDPFYLHSGQLLAVVEVEHHG